MRNKREVDTTTEVGQNGVVDDHEFPEPQFQQDPSTAKLASENYTNTYDGSNRLITFYQKVTSTSFTVVGVRHYAEYTIQVYACHDPDANNATLCSMTAVTSARTKQSGMRFSPFFLSFFPSSLIQLQFRV